MVFLVPPLFGDYWKFTFGFPVTVLVVMAIPYFFRRAGTLASIVALGALGGLHMFMGFRNAGGSCFVVGALLMLRYLPLRPRQALMLAGFVAILIASPRMVAHTFTSKSARANRSNIERAAMLQAAWEGFARSPLIGQGSWFSKSNVTDIFMDIRRENSMENAGSIGFDDVDVVTIHSQILMSLAEGGLFGGAFFFFYGLGLLWAIWYTLGEAPWSWLLPMRLFLFVANFWDILMSPFSGPARLNIALVTVLIAVCWEERQFARRSVNHEPVHFDHLPLPPTA
jgi:O-antigen ligase